MASEVEAQTHSRLSVNWNFEAVIILIEATLLSVMNYNGTAEEVFNVVWLRKSRLLPLPPPHRLLPRLLRNPLHLRPNPRRLPPRVPPSAALRHHRTGGSGGGRSRGQIRRGCGGVCSCPGPHTYSPTPAPPLSGAKILHRRRVSDGVSG